MVGWRRASRIQFALANHTHTHTRARCTAYCTALAITSVPILFAGIAKFCAFAQIWRSLLSGTCTSASAVYNDPEMITKAKALVPTLQYLAFSLIRAEVQFL